MEHIVPQQMDKSGPLDADMSQPSTPSGTVLSARSPSEADGSPLSKPSDEWRCEDTTRAFATAQRPAALAEPKVEPPPLSNASIALAEFASLLSGPDSSSGNQYLREHITHLLSNVDSSNTLVTVARALESAQPQRDSESTTGIPFEGSSHSDSHLHETGSTYTGGTDTPALRRRRWDPTLSHRRSTFGGSQTGTESHLDESNKTTDDPTESNYSGDLMMGDNGSVLNDAPLLFSSLVGGSMSCASTTSSAVNMDPLDQESPVLPRAVRLEGRRAAVSAIPSGLLSAGSPGVNFGASLSTSSSAAYAGLPVGPVTPEERAKLTALVTASHLFSSLEGPELEEVVRSMKKESYPAGTAVLEQGQDSKEKLFLIFDGTCEAIKQGKTLAAMQVGATFGELELMYKQIKCAATIRCVTNCVFFTLNEEAYHRAVMNDSVQKRRRFEQLTESAPFLRCLPQYERNKVAEALHTVQFKKGQKIIRFGEKGSHLYFIIEGQVKIVGRNQGRKVEVVRLHKGDVVGELEFLFNHLSVADVVVLSRRLRAARISREHFELIVGPIHDRLKEFIATSQSYEQYYVKSAADESVRSELSHASSTQRLRPRRVESASGRAESLTLLNVDPEGEMIISVPLPLIGGGDGADDETASQVRVGDEILRHEIDARGVAQRAFRFPLAPVTRNRWVLIGLREDGLILTWNKMCEKVTDYTAAEVVGQNIYSLLLEAADQKAMYHAIAHAKKYAGTVEGFDSDLRSTRRRKYTIARSDGLTKTVVELSVLPPVMARGCDETPEMVLAIGEEVSQGPQKALDQTHWLSKQVRLILADAELTYEDRLQKIAETLANYEDVYRAMTLSTERLRVVNIHQLMGLVIMDFAVECVQKRIAVCQRFEGLPSETAYLDAELLPQCLRYAMRTTTQFNESCQLTITVTVTEKSGLEFLVINFNVTGGAGFPEGYQEYVNLPLDEADEEAFLGTVRTSHTTITTGSGSDTGNVKQMSQLRRVRIAVEQQGGTIRIQQRPPETANILFLIPYMEAQEASDGDAGEKTFSQSGAIMGGAGGDMDSQASLSVTNTESAASLPTGGTEITFGGATPRSGAPGASITMESAQPTEDGPAYNFTTLVAEDTPAHRNMLCAYLWERRHAVLPAYTLTDIERLSGVADILFIDLQQSIMSSLTTHDPIALLREKARQMAVIITATDFDMVSAETYQKAGFITLKKPCTPVQALQAIRKAEEKIAAVKQEAERIAKTRETLAKNSRGAWKRGAMLGKGSFGEVYEAIDVLTGGKMAVKELRLGGQNNVKVENFVDEIATMCNLQHPNIIHYFYCEESMEGNSKIFRVFMEFAAGGSLQGLLSKKGKLPFAEFQRLLHDVTEGLAYIHAQNYVHGDIKTANVLLGHDEKGKIGDFGTARRMKGGELLYDMQGSPLYMSPECMSAGELDEDGEKIGYSYPTDIWSLGCVVLEMVTGKPPFSHIKKFNGPAGFTNFITSLSDTPDLSPLFSEPPSVTEFVSACLKPDPAERATAQDLLRMSVFSESADDDTKSALKALKRAQLLHVLNKFVAFQDPEDIQEKERQKNQFVTRQRSVTDFFASSSSSSSNSSRSEKSNNPRKDRVVPVNPKGTVLVRDFFSSSSSNSSNGSGSSGGNDAKSNLDKVSSLPANNSVVDEASAAAQGPADAAAAFEFEYSPTEFPPRRKSFSQFTAGSHGSSCEEETFASTGKPDVVNSKAWTQAAQEAAQLAQSTNATQSVSGSPGFASLTVAPVSGQGSIPRRRPILPTPEPCRGSSERDSSAEPEIRMPSPEAPDLSPTPKKRSRTRARGEEADAKSVSDETDAAASQTPPSANAQQNAASPQPSATAQEHRSHNTPSNAASWERSSSRHNARGSEGRGATAHFTNASFVNFSFNRNVSFMGANMNDVLNSVANDFMNTFAGYSPGRGSSDGGGTHSQLGSVHDVATNPCSSTMDVAPPVLTRKSSSTDGSAPVSAVGTDPTSSAQMVPSAHGDDGAGDAPTATSASRPAVVKAWLQKKLRRGQDMAAPAVPLSNRSFFMVQELDSTRLASSIRGLPPRSTLEGTASTVDTASLRAGTTHSSAREREAGPAQPTDASAPGTLFIPNAVLGECRDGAEGRRAAVVVAPPPDAPGATRLSASPDTDGENARSTSTGLLTDEALQAHRASFTESSEALQQLLRSPGGGLLGDAPGSGSAGASGQASPVAPSNMLVRIETELHSIAGQLRHLLEERVTRPLHADPLSPPAPPAAPRTGSSPGTPRTACAGTHARYVLPVSAIQPSRSASLSAPEPSQHTPLSNETENSSSATASQPVRKQSNIAVTPATLSSEVVMPAAETPLQVEKLKGDMESLLDHVERLQSFVTDQRGTIVSSSPPALDSGVCPAFTSCTPAQAQLLNAIQKYDRDCE